MKELVDKYRSWHGDTDKNWKLACIRLMEKDPATYIDKYQDLDWLYDDALDFLFYKSKTKILNLAKKMGYNEPPCIHCQNIIKYWDQSKELGYLWTPETAKKFKQL